MAIFLVFAQDTIGDPPVITYVNAVDLPTATTMVTNALASGIGVAHGLGKGTIQYAIVAAGAAGTVTPT
jgi:hypothetical protein